jgi:hypothetical protein
VYEREARLDDEWLRLTPAAQRADVSRMTLHRAAVAGEIPFAVMAGHRFFAAVDLRSWRDERLAHRSLTADEEGSN